MSNATQAVQVMPDLYQTVQHSLDRLCKLLGLHATASSTVDQLTSLLT